MPRRWKEAKGFPITGGATWTSYSLDPVTGLLFVPAGNPAPDFIKESRQGENLFASSDRRCWMPRPVRYQRHFQLVKRDFHDWDVSAPPALFLSNHGHRMLAEAPKDGHLYLIDLNTGKPDLSQAGHHHQQCRGADDCAGNAVLSRLPGRGGVEWAGVRPGGQSHFHRRSRLVHDGADGPGECLGKHAGGQALERRDSRVRQARRSEKVVGLDDRPATQTAASANGNFTHRFPLMGGVTPTTGRLVLFGDMGGNFYAFDAASGKKLWSKDLGGAIGGGVITYDTGVGQKIAVAAGMTSPIWPTPKGQRQGLSCWDYEAHGAAQAAVGAANSFARPTISRSCAAEFRALQVHAGPDDRRAGRTGRYASR